MKHNPVELLLVCVAICKQALNCQETKCDAFKTVLVAKQKSNESVQSCSRCIDFPHGRICCFDDQTFLHLQRMLLKT